MTNREGRGAWEDLHSASRVILFESSSVCGCIHTVCRVKAAKNSFSSGCKEEKRCVCMCVHMLRKKKNHLLAQGYCSQGQTIPNFIRLWFRVSRDLIEVEAFRVSNSDLLKYWARFNLMLHAAEIWMWIVQYRLPFWLAARKHPLPNVFISFVSSGRKHKQMRCKRMSISPPLGMTSSAEWIRFNDHKPDGGKDHVSKYVGSDPHGRHTGTCPWSLSSCSGPPCPFTVAFEC